VGVLARARVIVRAARGRITALPQWVLGDGLSGRRAAAGDGLADIAGLVDRAEISAGLKAGWSAARIARDLGRDWSVITREIARNSTKTCGYRVVSADVRAQRRRARPQARKVAADPLLCQRVPRVIVAVASPADHRPLEGRALGDRVGTLAAAGGDGP